MILKSLFSSKTRIKLLETFLGAPEQEFYIRELTRKLNEQINSIRRELENLKKIGLVRSRTRNRKKYFLANPSFIIFDELTSILVKTSAQDTKLKKSLPSFGEIQYAALTGKFVHDTTQSTDLLIVGNVVHKKVEDFMQKEYQKKYTFTILSPADFSYALETNDSNITSITKSKSTIVLIQKKQAS